MASYTHFSQEDRCVLAVYLREGLSLRDIAGRLQRSVGGILLASIPTFLLLGFFRAGKTTEQIVKEATTE